MKHHQHNECSTNANHGTKVTDPVCGMRIDPSSAKGGSLNYKNKIYYLTIKIKPNAKTTEILGVVLNVNNQYSTDKALQIAVKAPPIENKANHVLVKYLAKWLTVSVKAVSIKSGKTGRLKTIMVETDKDLKVILDSVKE